MSRDIKFRAWVRFMQKMARVDELLLNSGSALVNEYPYAIERDAFDLMQYTGLKDKNGVEIYEGDIVSQHTEWNDTTYFEGGYSSSDSCETETVGIVKIYPSKGVVITRCKKLDIIACDDNWEKAWDCNVRSYRATVIGNIHQNPELLSD